MVDCGRLGAVLRRGRVSILCALLVLGGVSLFRHDASRGSAAPRPGAITTSSLLARLPLAFEPNVGQSSKPVKFLARGRGYGLYLTPSEAVLTLPAGRGTKLSPGLSSPVLEMQFAGANAAASLSGMEKLPGHTNYFVGNDSSRWLRNVPQFARARYSGLYPGIDLDFYGKEGRLEYDFKVAPGADPRQIALQFQGAKSMQVAKNGDLVLSVSGRELRFLAPRAYQKSGDREEAVAGNFVVLAGGNAGFQIGDYDSSRALVIDPVLSFSTYLGGSGDESCGVIVNGSQSTPVPHCPAIAIDSASRVYIAGSTTSPGSSFPGAGSGLTLNGTADVFVSRISNAGSALVVDYVTYIGASGTQYPVGIAVDSGFNVYVAGNTDSSQFPTVNGFIGSASGNHAFLAKLDPGANILYSTYLAGSGADTASDLAVDSQSRAYILGTTTSNDFPTTPGALQGSYPAGVGNQFFFIKLDPALNGANSELYSTYFGGASAGGAMSGGAIAVDSNLNVYLAGGTTFTDIPVVNAYQATLKQTTPATVPTPRDVWAAKLKAPATNTQQYSLMFETYLGGTGDDVAYGVATDATNMYVTGSTTSPDIIPTATTLQTAAFQKCLDDPTNPTTCTTGATASDAFVAKFGTPLVVGTTQGSVPLNYITYLGGSGNESGLAITADSAQNVRLTGFTTSGGSFRNTNPLPGVPGGGTDTFLARIATASGSSSATSIIGGSGTDIGTSIVTDITLNSYIGGETNSGNFPTAASPGQPSITPVQASLSGNTDAFISQLGPTVTGLTLSCPVGVVFNGVAITACNPTGASVNPSPAGVGNQVTFTFPIYNTGDPVNGGIFTASVQGTNSVLTRATSSSGTCTSTTGSITAICNLGILNTSTASTSGANTTLSQAATATIVLTAPGTTPLLTTSSIGVTGVLNVVGTTLQTTLGQQGLINDFSVTASPAKQTVTAGNQATYTITVTPTGVFPESVSLGQCGNLPAGATCTFSGNPIPNLNNLAQNRTLDITTTPRTTTPASLFGSGRVFYGFWLPVSGLAFVGAGVTRKRRWLTAAFALCVLAFTILQAGCSSYSSKTQTTTGTPAGSYTVTLNATSGSAVRSTSVTLVVQ